MGSILRGAEGERGRPGGDHADMEEEAEEERCTEDFAEDADTASDPNTVPQSTVLREEERERKRERRDEFPKRSIPVRIEGERIPPSLQRILQAVGCRSYPDSEPVLAQSESVVGGTGQRHIDDGEEVVGKNKVEGVDEWVPGKNGEMRSRETGRVMKLVPQRPPVFGPGISGAGKGAVRHGPGSGSGLVIGEGFGLREK